MIIGDCLIDDDLFDMYCRSIVICHRSPTKMCDQQRRDLHNRLLTNCGINRGESEFSVELEKIVYERIGNKIPPKY